MAADQNGLTPFQVTELREKILAIEGELQAIKEILGMQPVTKKKPPSPPHDPESGIGEPMPKVVMKPR